MLLTLLVVSPSNPFFDKRTLPPLPLPPEPPLSRIFYQVELINNIRRNRPRLPPGVTLSPSCVELLGMLLVPQPEHRASLETFVSCAFLNPPVTTAPSDETSGDGSLPVSPHPTSGAKAAERAPAASRQSARPPAAAAAAATGGSADAAAGAHLSLYRAEQQQQQRSTGLSRPTTNSSDTADQQERPVPRRPDEAAGRTDASSSAIAGRATTSAGAGSASDAAAAADTRPPTCDGSVRKAETAGDPVGGRDGEWGWDWGGRGLTPALAAGSGGKGGSTAHVGVANEGPLPALPALPFALGPFGLRGSFAEYGGARRGAGGGDGDGGGSEASTGFAFDLAFAGSPVHSRSRVVSAAAVHGGGGGGGGSGDGGERERRSFSASDAVGPDGGRRNPVAAAPVAVVPPPLPATSAVASASASPGVPADKNGSRSSVATHAAGARRHRSHSFPGKTPPGQHRSGDQAASSNNTAGVSTPPSPVYYTSCKQGEHAPSVGAGAGGAAGESPARAGGDMRSSSSL